MPLILTCLWGESVKLKNESNLFTTKSNLPMVYAYVYISLLGFCKEIKILLEFFLYSNLKKNSGHWGLSIAYIRQVVLQQLEWNKNLKDIQNKWDMKKKNPHEF
jgi:hypothetical protein